MYKVLSPYRGWEGKRKKRAWIVYLTSIALSVGGGALCGGIACGRMGLYAGKVGRTPLLQAGIIFPVVWGVLYLLMGIGAARIYLKVDSEMRVYALKTYFGQLLFNWMWGIWLFNLQWYGFAFLWLMMLIVQAAWMIAAFRELDILAARLQIPYMLWLVLTGCWNVALLLR